MLPANLDVFRTSFSAGPPTKLSPIQIELTHDARPVKVKLQKYSSKQRTFLQKFVNDLIENGMVYPNPTSAWADEALLVPKLGAQFRFTVDLRLVNKYTVRHQFPMPNLEHEMT